MSLDFADLPFPAFIAITAALTLAVPVVAVWAVMWATAAVTNWWLGTRADAIELIESARRAGAGDE